MWRAERERARQEQDSMLRAQQLELMDEVTIQEAEMPQDSINFDDVLKSYTPAYDPDFPIGTPLPAWLHDAIQLRSIQDEFMYTLMVKHPEYIQYAVWDLPVPPTLPNEDKSFLGYLRKLNLPEVQINDAEISKQGPEIHINWLHTFNVAIQFSQAYLSPNWYQGGNDYLAFFGNLLWDVQLNNVFHPNLIFQSTLSYKLGINSTLNDKYHKYSVSQELFQYNLKLGYKAAKKWYYSFTTLFKTQFLHAYPANSTNRMAAFLSPGELNLGIGMTYNLTKPNNKMSFSMSLAPLSYNLKTCIDDLVDHTQLGMEHNQRTKNEIGSNGEINFYWAFRDNISYKTRLFLFTDYKNFTSDWENTLNFQFSKYFSTQLYVYFRYDTASDSKIAPKWKKWMLKEILSLGLSYTFSTK